MTKPISKWMLIRTFVLIAAALCLVSAANNRGDRSEIGAKEAHRINESLRRDLTSAKLPGDLGGLRFSYGRRRSFRGLAADHAVLISQRAVYHTVEELKKQIELPFDIKVVFKDCGGPDSYYDGDSHEIVMCYELVATYSDLFSRTIKARSDGDEAARDAVVSIFLHEVAHALIDRWDLPITGREEDAADQFSTLVLINDTPNGERIALEGARSYQILAELESGEKKDYSDPHSQDEQRFFNTICLVYGHRPEQHEYLIRNGSLPVERAYGCEKDYDRVNKSWQKLLAPHRVHVNAPSLQF